MNNRHNLVCKCEYIYNYMYIFDAQRSVSFWNNLWSALFGLFQGSICSFTLVQHVFVVTTTAATTTTAAAAVIATTTITTMPPPSPPLQLTLLLLLLLCYFICFVFLLKKYSWLQWSDISNTVVIFSLLNSSFSTDISQLAALHSWQVMFQVYPSLAALDRCFSLIVGFAWKRAEMYPDLSLVRISFSSQEMHRDPSLVQTFFSSQSQSRTKVQRWVRCGSVRKLLFMIILYKPFITFVIFISKEISDCSLYTNSSVNTRCILAVKRKTF